ncbi:MAG: hypothetical protein IPN29_11240 [Saprospiraceae bacterium]|nr:hypothetical protein [Saprospiraceae bacterium]
MKFSWTSKVLLLFALVLTSLSLIGQEVPYLKNFSPSIYKAARQNWSITQDTGRIMYFGNGAGLLRFDGSNWQTFQLGGGKNVRSVLAIGNRVYTGSYGEFGYWTTGKDKSMVYTSLVPLIGLPAFGKEEVWNIVAFKGRIYFQSFGLLLVYDGQKVKRIDIPGTIMFLQQAGEKLYLPVIDAGLFEYFEGGFSLVKGTELLAGSTITSILSVGSDSLLISTNDMGVFELTGRGLKTWGKTVNKLLTYAQVNKAIKISPDLLCFATIRYGLVTYNVKTAEVIQFNTSNGLLNNTVLSLCSDMDGGLWLGLDKGISYTVLDSNLSYFRDNQGKLGTIYTSAILGETKYLGTNQGLYRYRNFNLGKNGSAGVYEPVESIQGQVWHLLDLGDILVCAHNTGTHLITKEQITRLYGGTGGWHTVKFPHREDVLIQATYNGLIVFKKIKDWQFSHKIKGIEEAIERIEPVDSIHYWIAGPSGNLRKIELDAGLDSVVNIIEYGAEKGLSNVRKIEISLVGKSTYAYTADSLFLYLKNEDRFVFTGNKGSRYRKIGMDLLCKLYSDSLLIEARENKIMLPLTLSKEYNSICQLQDHSTMLIQEDGYVLVNHTPAIFNRIRPQAPIRIDYVLLENGHKLAFEENNIVLPYENRTFTLYFHEAVYDQELAYKFILIGPDTIRSNWQPGGTFAAYNLVDGYYQLWIESNSGKKASVTWQVRPPWYSSRWMKAFYLLLFFFLGYAVKVNYHKELKSSRLKLEVETERKLREHKIALDNEKLKEENMLKSQELVNTTVQLIKKNELLLEIKQELIDIRKGDEVLNIKEFQKMLRQINENISSENDNKLFESNFNDIHEVFFKKLLGKYPNLSPQDLKLAAYLKMNLATKEIAPLFNISIRGLENKRYRLRSKLGLSPDVNLTEFFIGFD